MQRGLVGGSRASWEPAHGSWLPVGSAEGPVRERRGRTLRGRGPWRNDRGRTSGSRPVVGAVPCPCRCRLLGALRGSVLPRCSPGALPRACSPAGPAGASRHVCFARLFACVDNTSSGALRVAGPSESGEPAGRHPRAAGVHCGVVKDRSFGSAESPVVERSCRPGRLTRSVLTVAPPSVLGAVARVMIAWRPLDDRSMTAGWHRLSGEKPFVSTKNTTRENDLPCLRWHGRNSGLVIERTRWTRQSASLDRVVRNSVRTRQHGWHGSHRPLLFSRSPGPRIRPRLSSCRRHIRCLC